MFVNFHDMQSRHCLITLSDRYLIEFSCFVAFEKEPISDGSAKMSIVEEYDDLVSNNRNRALRDISIFINKWQFLMISLHAINNHAKGM